MYGIYHSRDLDGYCSGAIIKKRYPEAILIGFDYGEGLAKLADQLPGDATVIMADVSLPIQEMGELAAMVDKLIWIDHHKSAIDDYNKHLAADHPNGTNVGLIEAVLEDGIAACEGTWKYLFPKREIPIVVQLLGEYDTWRNSDPEHWRMDILPFQFGMRTIVKSPETFPEYFLWHPSSRNSVDVQEKQIEKIKNTGVTILEYQRSQNEFSMKKAFVIDFHGHRALACNSGSGSTSFESVWDEEKHDLMMTFKYTGTKWVFGIYTTKDIDLSLLAKEHGGGGHKKAAGFMCDDIPDFIFLKQKETMALFKECALNLGHPAYNVSSSTTIAIDDLRERALDYLNVPKQ